MVDLLWLIKRLKAMSNAEVIWRLSQTILQNKEKKIFRPQKMSVTAYLFNSNLEGIDLYPSKLALNLTNTSYSLETSIPLLGDYDYEQYRFQWKAGFQTKKEWPDEFSYVLNYKQRDDIGDARTNWELNRHFQFALLAKNYMASGNQIYLIEFQRLFEDWNQKNPFLWGISWTSIMEIAIRTSNWCYSFCFLSSRNAPVQLLEQLKIGILNMTDYIVRHYSRYSSANNHLIIEAYTIAQSGILFQNEDWTELGISLLTRELPLQNYIDGVNKELSLHYQSFYMEAMGLTLRLMRKNKITIPDNWMFFLDKMGCYVASCIGIFGEVIEFGDNDEGKILDLQGGINHYEYVLGMYSVLLNKQYTNMNKIKCENLDWLFTEQELNQAKAKPRFIPDLISCYKEGGTSIFRSNNERILIGIDHAALGFGSIAAHGHADALSFQLYVEGHPLFVDPGTYLYHCDLSSRNAFRKTENHNTVCINEENQSEMLGAFLWGRKAQCELTKFEKKKNLVILRAKHDGYQPIIHEREFVFDRENIFQIIDSFNEVVDKTVNFIFASNAIITIADFTVTIEADGIYVLMKITCDDDINTILTVRKSRYSPAYGKQENAYVLCVKTKAKKVGTTIYIR